MKVVAEAKKAGARKRTGLSIKWLTANGKFCNANCNFRLLVAHWRSLLHWLSCFVGRNPQRAEESAIVGGDLEHATRLRHHSPRRCGDLGERCGLRSAHKPYDRFEGHFHLE